MNPRGESQVPRVVLASSSRYRRMLLEQIGLGFECMHPGVDESLAQGDATHAPRELARHLAILKARDVHAHCPDAIVIGSDQVAALDDRILTKPGGRERNLQQLLELSGRTHELWTAVCVVSKAREITWVNRTQLCMRPLNDAELARYIEFDKAWDCAGGYRIEGQGIVLFERIEATDFTAIQGLPLIELTTVLRDLGVPLP